MTEPPVRRPGMRRPAANVAWPRRWQGEAGRRGHRNLEVVARNLTRFDAEAEPVALAAGGGDLGAMPGREQATEPLRETGFGAIELHELKHELENDHGVCRP